MKINKQIVMWAFLVAFVIVGGVVFSNFKINSKQPIKTEPVIKNSIDAENMTFNIDGEMVTLKDGVYRAPTVPDYASSREARLLEGNSLNDDISGDKINDRVVILVDQPGGTGVFYYIVPILGKKDGVPVPGKAVFLGDRIIPQSISFSHTKNLMSVSILDRKETEPFSVTPTVSKRFSFKVVNGELVTVK